MALAYMCERMHWPLRNTRSRRVNRVWLLSPARLDRWSASYTQVHTSLDHLLKSKPIHPSPVVDVWRSGAIKETKLFRFTLRCRGRPALSTFVEGDALHRCRTGFNVGHVFSPERGRIVLDQSFACLLVGWPMERRYEVAESATRSSWKYGTWEYTEIEELLCKRAIADKRQKKMDRKMCLWNSYRWFGWHATDVKLG